MATRKYTDMILDMVRDRVLDKDDVISACLNYMSEAEVQDMAESEGFIDDDTDDDADDEEEE